MARTHLHVDKQREIVTQPNYTSSQKKTLLNSKNMFYNSIQTGKLK